MLHLIISQNNGMNFHNAPQCFSFPSRSLRQKRVLVAQPTSAGSGTMPRRMFYSRRSRSDAIVLARRVGDYATRLWGYPRFERMSEIPLLAVAWRKWIPPLGAKTDAAEQELLSPPFCQVFPPCDHLIVDQSRTRQLQCRPWRAGILAGYCRASRSRESFAGFGSETRRMVAEMMGHPSRAKDSLAVTVAARPKIGAGRSMSSLLGC